MLTQAPGPIWLAAELSVHLGGVRAQINQFQAPPRYGGALAKQIRPKANATQIALRSARGCERPHRIASDRTGPDRAGSDRIGPLEAGKRASSASLVPSQKSCNQLNGLETGRAPQRAALIRATKRPGHGTRVVALIDAAGAIESRACCKSLVSQPAGQLIGRRAHGRANLISSRHARACEPVPAASGDRK